jgi:hypothetical protein
MLVDAFVNKFKAAFIDSIDVIIITMVHGYTATAIYLMNICGQCDVLPHLYINISVILCHDAVLRGTYLAYEY